MLFFVEVVVVLLFCRHLTFELVVDCVRAGLEKKRGVEGVRSPPRGGGGGGVGGGGAPPFAKK